MTVFFILLWVVFIAAIMDDPEGIMLDHLASLEAEIEAMEASKP